ncbi:MAG TPA: CoA-binding protein, partial [Longimicrobiales bacterium]|nr:CoA-binding protein [Longimicrobiales bacterium]
MSSHPLDVIFRPSSVAVIGASSDPRKRGNHAVRALVRGGYRGTVYPVNPGGGVLYDLPVHRELDELPETPELALVCTPAETVPGIVERCGEAGVKAAVVLAVGFSESDGEGEALE